mgnify:CR=1 FL=1
MIFARDSALAAARLPAQLGLAEEARLSARTPASLAYAPRGGAHNSRYAQLNENPKKKRGKENLFCIN